MDRRESELNLSYQYDSDHLNSKQEHQADNLLALLRAWAGLNLVFNSVEPRGEVPPLPENHLRERAYRIGLDGFFKAGGPKWP
jgi:hypothetical protein